MLHLLFFKNEKKIEIIFRESCLYLLWSNKNQALLSNNSNANPRSKFTAYVTVARGYTRDMQQTNYLHRINWNWVRARRLSDAATACSRDSIFNPAFDAFASRPTCKNFDLCCNWSASVDVWFVGREISIVRHRNRPFRLIAYTDIIRSVPLADF